MIHFLFRVEPVRVPQSPVEHSYRTPRGSAPNTPQAIGGPADHEVDCSDNSDQSGDFTDTSRKITSVQLNPRVRQPVELDHTPQNYLQQENSGTGLSAPPEMPPLSELNIEPTTNDSSLLISSNASGTAFGFDIRSTVSTTDTKDEEEDEDETRPMKTTRV